MLTLSGQYKPSTDYGARVNTLWCTCSKILSNLYCLSSVLTMSVTDDYSENALRALN